MGVLTQSMTTADFITSSYKSSRIAFAKETRLILVVKLFAVSGHFDEERCWPSAFAQRFKRLQHFYNLRRSERICPEKQSAFERREAQPKDQSQIHIAGISDDVILQSSSRLQQHWQE